MRIEEVKRWQWSLFGLVVGLLLGWAWCGYAASDGLTDAVTLGAEQFERGLAQKPLEGHPKFKQITLHHRAGRDVLQVKVLEPDPKDPHPHNPRHYRYVWQQLNPTTPFLPSFREAPTQTVMIRVNPSAISKVRGFGRHEDAGPLPLWINGAAVGINEFGQHLRLKDWKIQTAQWADPGHEAELGLVLRPANYQMLIVLSTTQEKLAAASDLAVKLNGHDLPAPKLVQKSSGASLETTVPRDAFAPGAPEQLLTFSRKGEPVRIWEVRLIDTSYSIADYLSYVKTAHPEIDVRTAWWDGTLARYAIACLGSIVFFTVVFPILIQLFTGAQPGKSAPEPEYDLSRFEGEPEKKVDEKRSDEALNLEAIEEELKKGLAERVASADQPKPAPAAPAPLNTEAAAAPVTAEDPNSPEYKGEYYPVANKRRT